jgi:hypothetical protein
VSREEGKGEASLSTMKSHNLQDRRGKLAMETERIREWESGETKELGDPEAKR